MKIVCVSYEQILRVDIEIHHKGSSKSELCFVKNWNIYSFGHQKIPFTVTYPSEAGP